MDWEGDLEEIDRATKAAYRTRVFAGLEADDLRSSIGSFRRDMVLASTLGIVALAICAGIIALYRHSPSGVPAVVIVCCSLGLVAGLGQLSYIAYQLLTAVPRAFYGVKVTLALQHNADRYIESLREFGGSVAHRSKPNPSRFED